MGRYELPELFERGQNFVKSIAGSDNVLVIHHADVDGYCSASIFVSALKRVGIKNIETVDIIVDDMERFSKTKKIRKFNKIIILLLKISMCNK